MDYLKLFKERLELAKQSEHWAWLEYKYNHNESSYEYWTEEVRMITEIIERLEAGEPVHDCRECKYYTPPKKVDSCDNECDTPVGVKRAWFNIEDRIFCEHFVPKEIENEND